MVEEVLWNCEAKTRAKLEIVSSYLGAWFGILARKGFRHVVYIDGFCGPGEYKTGEKGSPVIAAGYASSTAQKTPGFRATLILVDKDQKALNHLQSISAIKKPHPNVEIIVMQGEFAEKIDEIVAYLRKYPNSPTFGFIDPFGFGQSPFGKIKDLMHNQHSELFVNLMCGFMNRFKEHKNEDVTAKIKAMIDAKDLDHIIAADDPIDALCDHYEASLKRIGKFTLKFMMRDEKNIRDNAVFFCGQNSKGFEKIKEAMWKTDPEGGNSFSSHLDTKGQFQDSLFEVAAQSSRLSQFLLTEYANRKDVPVSEIFQWVIDKTDVFLPRHTRKELESLLQRGKISFVDPASNGRKRRENDWPPRLLVTFTA